MTKKIIGRARAIRRCGELLKEIQPSPGGRPAETHTAGDTSFSRTQVANDAGRSKRQKDTALCASPTSRNVTSKSRSKPLRRHLSESQRAIVAAEIANLKRGHVASQKSELQIYRSEPITVKQAADMLNVSEKSAFNARAVLSQATPEEIEAVKQGQAAVGTVAKMIRQGAEPESPPDSIR